jgi:hypothetical protein
MCDLDEPLQCHIIDFVDDSNRPRFPQEAHTISCGWSNGCKVRLDLKPVGWPYRHIGSDEFSFERSLWLKNFMKFKHGKTEGEANNTLGMLLLTLIAVTYRLSPWLLGAVGGYWYVR